MAKSVSFTLKSGTVITLSLVTERALAADASMTKPCWSLVARIGDGMATGNRVGLEDHPTAGRVLRIEKNLAVIPADKLAEVEALVAEYNAGVEARHAAWLEDAKAEAEYNRVARRIADDLLPPGGAR